MLPAKKPDKAPRKVKRKGIPKAHPDRVFLNTKDARREAKPYTIVVSTIDQTVTKYQLSKQFNWRLKCETQS